jgi:hypothetical protein
MDAGKQAKTAWQATSDAIVSTLTARFLLLISIFCVKNVKIWQRIDGVYPEAKNSILLIIF